MIREYTLHDQHVPSLANVRMHWAKRAKLMRSHRMLGALMANTLHWRGERAVVRLTRIAPRELDSDNLVSSFKGFRDGVAQAFGIDDRNPIITWTYAQERGAPKQCAVRITLMPIAESMAG